MSGHVGTTISHRLDAESWGFFGVGAYLLYWALSGWYGESSGEEAKLAFATLLGILAFPLGAFVRRWAGSVSRYSGEELVEHIFHEIESFTDGCLQEDDQTLVVIRSLKDVEPALA